MARRNSPLDVQGIAALGQLADLVVDKRIGKRSVEKRNRRNRHYENQFIRNVVAQHSSDETNED